MPSLFFFFISLTCGFVSFQSFRELLALLNFSIFYLYSIVLMFWSYFKNFFYLFIFKERGREGEREGEKHQRVVTSSIPPTAGLAATQTYSLTGNQTSDPLVHRPALNPPSHTSQGMVLLSLFPFFSFFGFNLLVFSNFLKRIFRVLIFSLFSFPICICCFILLSKQNFRCITKILKGDILLIIEFKIFFTFSLWFFL